jgi:EF-P beta-lysylation protein EpmB
MPPPAAAVTDPAALLRRLQLAPVLPAGTREAMARLPFRVPESFAARMRPGDPADPLLRQVWPAPEEMQDVDGFTGDPVGDAAARVAPGLLHKYHGRALLLATAVCSVHCRYCFRRDFPYPAAGAGDWRPALAYLAGHPDIEEIILSGGDPLTLSNRRLGELLSALAAIPSLRRLRIHSREPIVRPERVDAGLLKLLDSRRFPTVVVVHANHPREIDGAVTAALVRLRDVRAQLLNQAVLLRGVNDSAPVLAELSAALFRAGVLPYYLHTLDQARGTAHFQVEAARATIIMDQLRNRLPGYLVPRLVREEPGKSAKTLIG